MISFLTWKEVYPVKTIKMLSLRGVLHSGKESFLLLNSLHQYNGLRNLVSSEVPPLRLGDERAQ